MKQSPTPQEVHQAVEAAYQHMAGQYWPPLQEKMEGIGFEGFDLFLTRRAARLAGGITQALLVAQFPYDAPDALQAKLDATVERGFITGTEKYIATEKGGTGIAECMAVITAVFTKQPPLNNADCSRLLQLMTERNEANAQAADPIQKPALSSAQQINTPEDANWMQINQQFGILNAFRDDAHAAAWQTMLDIPGQQWEAFNHVCGENVWGDPVPTAEAVAEKLAFRGYGLDEYTAVLQDCVQRGWLAAKDGTYTVTTAGKQLCQNVEETTDSIFYAPWSALNNSDLTELNTLLMAMSQTLQAEES